jgi:hypothetical protein
VSHGNEPDIMSAGGASVKNIVIGVAVAALMALGGAAWGDASLLGPTGLVAIPTAEVLGMAQWNVGISGLWIGDNNDATVLYGNVGLLPRLEVGAARQDFDQGEAETLLNAKLGLMHAIPGEVSLAVGVVDLTDQIDRSPYVVMSHTLGAGVIMRKGMVTSPQVHVGIGGGRFDGLFAGFSAMINDDVKTMAEFDGDHFNLGATWPLGPNLTGTLAVLNDFGDLGAGLTFSSPW